MIDEDTDGPISLKSSSSSFTQQLPVIKVTTRNCHLSAQGQLGLPLSEVGRLRCSRAFVFYIARFCAQAALAYSFNQKQKSLLVSGEEKGGNRGERAQGWCAQLQTPKVSISDEIFTFF